MATERKTQLFTAGVAQPDARPGQRTLIGGNCLTQPLWVKDWEAARATTKMLLLPPPENRGDFEKVAWQPDFYRRDKKYMSTYAGKKDGVSHGAAAIKTRTFTCFNSCPITRVNENTGVRQVMIADDSLPEGYRWDKYEDDKHMFDFSFAGFNIDTVSNESRMNVSSALYIWGNISCVNNSMEDLQAGDYIRFDCPQPGKQFYIPDSKDLTKMVPLWGLKEGDQFDINKPDMRFYAGVFKVPQRKLDLIGYHARVELGGGPGQKLWIRLAPDGEVVH